MSCAVSVCAASRSSVSVESEIAPIRCCVLLLLHQFPTPIHRQVRTVPPYQTLYGVPTVPTRWTVTIPHLRSCTSCTSCTSCESLLLCVSATRIQPSSRPTSPLISKPCCEASSTSHSRQQLPRSPSPSPPPPPPRRQRRPGSRFILLAVHRDEVALKINSDPHRTESARLVVLCASGLRIGLAVLGAPLG